jgi:hypothetical protein
VSTDFHDLKCSSKSCVSRISSVPPRMLIDVADPLSC